MKKKDCFNKGIALVLSATMVLGLVPSLPGIDTKARAGNGSALSPSVTAYATTEDLKTKFKPNTEGTQAVGTLALGKSGLTWYILGQDKGEGVKDVAKDKTEKENTVIFATGDMKKR